MNGFVLFRATPLLTGHVSALRDRWEYQATQNTGGATADDQTHNPGGTAPACLTQNTGGATVAGVPMHNTGGTVAPAWTHNTEGVAEDRLKYNPAFSQLDKNG